MKILGISAILCTEQNITEVNKMIIQIKGKVTYPITLDPSVWIFDDRKIMFEEAFTAKETKQEIDPAQKAAELFNQELYSLKSIKPPVNKSLSKPEQKKALIHSFVMPIKDFIATAAIENEAKRAVLTTNEDDVILSLDQLKEALFLFAIDGKQIDAENDGPVYLYFGDGSNQSAPITGIKEITIE